MPRALLQPAPLGRLPPRPPQWFYDIGGQLAGRCEMVPHRYLDRLH